MTWTTDIQDAIADYDEAFNAAVVLKGRATNEAHAARKYLDELSDFTLTESSPSVSNAEARESMHGILKLAGIDGAEALAARTKLDIATCKKFWKEPIKCGAKTRSDVLKPLSCLPIGWEEGIGPNGETLGELLLDWETRCFPWCGEHYANVCHVISIFYRALSHICSPATVARLYALDARGAARALAEIADRDANARGEGVAANE